MNDTIKTNCAHCAHKHLTAAYALLTSNAGWDEAPKDAVMLELLLHARALITCEEAYNGYLGNFDLTIGCLAAAETLTHSADDASRYREMRSRIISGTRSREEALTDFGAPRGLTTLAFAHLAEAKRELPGLALPEMALARTETGELCVHLPSNREAYLNMLVTLIHDVAELYELHPKEVKS